MSRCRHIWIQDKADEVQEGVTRYFHTCPHCGKKKETLRAHRALPVELKWKREVEKLVIRAVEAGVRIHYENKPLNCNKVTVHAC